MVIGGIAYVCTLFIGSGVTNLTAWLVWSLVSVVSTATYYSGIKRNLKSSLLYFAGTGTTLFITVVAIFHGNLESLVLKDYVALALTACAVILWFFAGPGMAHVLVQLAGLVGFIHLWISIRRGLAHEDVVVWGAWAFSYIVLLVGIAKYWNQNRDYKDRWIEFAGPLNYFWLHTITLVVILFSEK